MMEPFVSIIVPVYKVPEQYLRKCIESTMTQTLKNIEILLVDDGSPDQCGKICDEYAEKDKRIRVLHKKMVDSPRLGITAVKLHRENGSCLWMVMIGLNQICAKPCIVPEKKNRYSLLCVAL